jgi:hypothetical protein
MSNRKFNKVKITCDGTYSGRDNGVFMEDGTRIDHVREIHLHLEPDSVPWVEMTVIAPDVNAIALAHVQLDARRYFRFSWNLFLFRFGQYLRSKFKKNEE